MPSSKKSTSRLPDAIYNKVSTTPSMPSVPELSVPEIGIGKIRYPAVTQIKDSLAVSNSSDNMDAYEISALETLYAIGDGICEVSGDDGTGPDARAFRKGTRNESSAPESAVVRKKIGCLPRSKLVAYQKLKEPFRILYVAESVQAQGDIIAHLMRKSTKFAQSVRETVLKMLEFPEQRPAFGGFSAVRQVVQEGQNETAQIEGIHAALQGRPGFLREMADWQSQGVAFALEKAESEDGEDWLFRMEQMTAFGTA